jgi:type I restriction enzyme S subunit
VVRRGDLLVGMDGEFNVVEWGGDDALLNQRVCRLLPDTERLDADFLHQRIKIDLKRIEDQTPSTTVKHLSSKQIANLDWDLPPIAEQRRIATRLKAQLAAAETARKAAQAQAMEVEALQQSIYREAFANIVPVAVPPDFDAAPNGWHWVRLNEIARLESGHTPSRSRPDWWGGDVSWLSLTEIRALDGQWVEETKIRTNPEGIAHSAARILPRGTVCYSRTASVGFVAIMAKPMATSQDFANWVCSDALEPEFLMHALIRSRHELRALATGATHKTIYMPTLQNFHLCLPDRTAQQRIVADLKQRLAALGRMRAAMQAQFADLETLPARLLAQVFDPTSKEVTP